MNSRQATASQDNILRLPEYDGAQAIASVPGDKPGATSEARIAAALERIRALGGAPALMVLRISDYRVFSDTFGDAFASELIEAVEKHLHSELRVSDIACKVGDDEFAIVLGGLRDIEDISAVTRRLVRRCSGRYDLGPMSPLVKMTAGIALYPVDTDEPADLLRYARIALQGADGDMQPCHFFSQELLKCQQHKLWMEAELERALADGRFTLHYQPQYTVEGHDIVGMEALVRIIDESGELIQPDQFISIAENNGFIVKLGNWVIREACRQLAEWRAAGCGPLRMAVNVSPLQLVDEQLLGVVTKTIREFGLDFCDLELEITEQRMFDYMSLSNNVLHELRSLGVRIAIDDFGTGYSSFAHLANMPIDMFKMDRSFLSNIAGDGRAELLVSSMIGMAKGLGLEIVAEGIETDEQHQFIQSTGCDFGQGFGLARPQTAAVIEKLLFDTPDMVAAC